MIVSSFSEALKEARISMEKGAFRDAFSRIADEPVSRPDELFHKVALMADAGIALRDGTMLEYGLYLLEHHSGDILDVPSLASFLWLNIAHLRCNLLAVREAEGGRRCWYERKQTAPAREAFRRAFDAAGDDEELKVRILTSHALLLAGLGRDWEAFGLFHKATILDGNDEEARLGRAQMLSALSGTVPALEKSLLRESAEELEEILRHEEGPGRNEEAELLLNSNIRRLGDESGIPADYPKHTVVTDTEREHSMVMFALKEQLYLTPCARCRRCDRAVGDAAALGAYHASLGGAGSGRYRNMAILTGRLTERYRVVRAALIGHHRQEDLPDGADHQPHFPEVEGWRPVHPSSSVLAAVLAGTPAVMEGMAACIAAYLGREVKGPVRPDHILGTPGAPGSSLMGVSNPALHGFWDLWADGVDGLVEGADLTRLFGSSLSSADVGELSLDAGELTRRATAYCGWLRDLIGYLIRMADRDARGETADPPLWPLQPFIMPKGSLLARSRKG